MKKQNSMQNGAVLLSYLLSSPIIFNPLYKSNNKIVASLITLIIGIIITALISRIYNAKTKIKENSLSKVLNMFSFIAICFFTATYVCEFTRTTSVFSQYYSGSTYRTVLAISIILVSFYASFSKLSGLFRFCSTALIIFAAYYLFMYFGLFSLTETISPHEIFTVEFSKEDLISSIKGALFIFFDVSVFYFISAKINKDTNCKKIPWLRTLLIYCAILLSNLSRTCFTFGSNLTSQIQNCDIASIKLIPAFDITEIVILVCGFAIVLKCAFFFFAAKKVLENVCYNQKALYITPFITFVLFVISDLYVDNTHIFSSTIYTILACLLPILLFLCILFSNTGKNTNK